MQCSQLSAVQTKLKRCLPSCSGACWRCCRCCRSSQCTIWWKVNKIPSQKYQIPSMPIACSKSFINHYTRGISWLLKCQEKAGCPMCRVAGVRRWRRKATWPMTSDLRCSITTPSDLIISISKDFFSSINGSFVLWVPRIVKVWVLFGHFRAFLVFVGTFWFCLGLFICTIWNIWLTFVIWCTLWFCLVLIGSVWYFFVLFGTLCYS